MDGSADKKYYKIDDWNETNLCYPLEVIESRIYEGYISRISLKENPELTGLRILRMKNETNYLLNDSATNIINSLWDNFKSNKNMCDFNFPGQLDFTKIISLKEVGDGVRWAYMEYSDMQPFRLHWPKTQLGNVKKQSVGEIIVLKQQRRLTHLVVPYSNLVGKDPNNERWPFYREVICLKKLDNDIAPQYKDIFPISLQGGSHGIGIPLQSFIKSHPGVITLKELQTRIWEVFFFNKKSISVTLPYSDEADFVYSNFIEGKKIYQIYAKRVRSAQLKEIKKQKAIAKYGKLYCEICGFSFFDTYGEIGEDFIEAHHKNQLSNYDDEKETKERDIALLCSNCHSMVHTRDPAYTIESIKQSLENRRKSDD